MTTNNTEKILSWMKSLKRDRNIRGVKSSLVSKGLTGALATVAIKKGYLKKVSHNTYKWNKGTPSLQLASNLRRAYRAQYKLWTA